MEKLKSVIAPKLKQKISESSANDLNSTCSSLIDFYKNLPVFHQMVRDLTDPEMALCRKNKEAAVESKERGNACFANGEFLSAVRCYSQALQVAPVDVDDLEKNLMATLYVNRASSFHKLGHYVESLRDCSRALAISTAYAKAWFRRAKANVMLGNHGDAINDLNISLNIETSLSGRRQIQNELNIVLDQCEQKTNGLEKPIDDIPDDPMPKELQCVPTPTKGRGMICFDNISEASLIHKEEPYAAIILKQCRKTHCHYCFNELPLDTVPCIQCSIPVYCSTKCQLNAGGRFFLEHESQYKFLRRFSADLGDYVEKVTSLDIDSSDIEYTAEHKHECQGVHWPMVLPSDIVLAGRVLVRCLQQQKISGVDPDIHGILDLCQNYEQFSSESKLELHVYSVILFICLQQFCALNLPFNPVIISEIIMLLSQIRVNSMAIVRMKYSDGDQSLDFNGVSSVEQVRVAQAIYSIGSLFNHSCKPNAHAYFISRTLFVRATEYVAEGSHLELSYGPQVGQMDCSERRQVLEDRYSFTCQCSCCALLNLSDLVINSYACNEPKCLGVVFDNHTNCEKEILKHFNSQISLQGYSFDNDINRVASRVFEKSNYNKFLQPCYCLNCGNHCDIEASRRILFEEQIYIRRLQDTMVSGEVTTNIVTDALKSIDVLKTKLHPFNKKLAEVEDTIAQALCITGELQEALNYCQASIKILEKLYGEEHIVIGNELIKLVSIKLLVGCESAGYDSRRLSRIFSRYYGSHAQIVFPHLIYLKMV